MRLKMNKKIKVLKDWGQKMRGESKMNENALVVFQDKKIRRIWQNNEWYFSVVDIVEALTDSPDAKDYWYRLKKRERESNGTELSTFCRQLKLPSSDGKSYATDCANTKNMFRIIQTIPSQKAEPPKQWLAQVGYARTQEFAILTNEISQATFGLPIKSHKERKGLDPKFKTQNLRDHMTDLELTISR